MEKDGSVDFPDRDEIEAGLLKAAIKSFCPMCGKEVVQTGRGRPRVFCSRECQRAWQNKYQCPPFRKTAVEIACPVCGRKFYTDRLKSRPRKYCSRACANIGRKRQNQVTTEEPEVSSDVCTGKNEDANGTDAEDAEENHNPGHLL